MFSRLPALHLQKTRHAGLRIKPAQPLVKGIWALFFVSLTYTGMPFPRGDKSGLSECEYDTWKIRGRIIIFVGIECTLQFLNSEGAFFFLELSQMRN